MWTTRRINGLILSGLLIAGCTENKAEEPMAQFRAQVVTGNGATLNGMTLNGWTLNGWTLNGQTLNGVTLNGVTLNGTTLNGFTLNGVTLNGQTLNGVTLNGLTLNGVTLNGVTLNGVTLNGLTLNGVTLNGLTLNGVTLNGVTLNGVTLNGTRLEGMGMAGSVFFAYYKDGRAIAGNMLVGLTIEVTVAQPTSEKYYFRIDSFRQDTSSPFPDVFHYGVSVKTTSNPTPRSLCYDESKQPTDLVPVNGMAWDENTGNRIDDPKTFTLACTEGAIEKCMHLGYRPWASQKQCKGGTRGRNCPTINVPLKDYHQACTRMIRADYCGNGQSWTKDGTLLDVYDYLLPPIQLQEENWQIESRWVPTGAICLTEERHPELKFPGYCMTDGRKTKLPKCQCYEDNRGLLVSTFNDDPSRKGKKQDD